MVVSCHALGVVCHMRSQLTSLDVGLYQTPVVWRTRGEVGPALLWKLGFVLAAKNRLLGDVAVVSSSRGPWSSCICHQVEHYRKSLPKTSCGDLTAPSRCSTLLTSPSMRRTCTRWAHWSLLITSLILELCSLQTVAGSTSDHTSHHFWVSRSGYCCSLLGSVLSFLLTD